jgi:hypothetical protein
MDYDTWKTTKPNEPSEQESEEQFDDEMSAGEEKFEENRSKK